MKLLSPLLYASIASLLFAFQPAAYAQPKDRPLPESPGESKNAPSAEPSKSQARAERPAKSQKRRAKSPRRAAKETN